MKSEKPLEKRNRAVFVNTAAIAVGMFGIAYASAPLYNLFCRVTGYGGATQVAETKPQHVTDRRIAVRFDANTAPDLGWNFKPEQKEIIIRAGENALAFYSAENLTGASLTGTATYNVTPTKAGAYFTKIECFCFDRQTLAPHEKTEFPVSFFIDPEIVRDENLDDVHTITLSYTFFKVKDEAIGKP